MTADNTTPTPASQPPAPQRGTIAHERIPGMSPFPEQPSPARSDDVHISGNTGDGVLIIPARSDKDADLSDAQTRAALEAYFAAAKDGHSFGTCIKRAVLAAQESAPSSEAVDWRAKCEALLDIWDDAQRNPPESRCYVEGAWPDMLGEIRAALARSATAGTTAAPTCKCGKTMNECVVTSCENAMDTGFATPAATAAPNVMDDRRAFHEWFNGTMYRADAEEAMLIGWQASTAYRHAGTAAPGDLPTDAKLIGLAAESGIYGPIPSVLAYGRACIASNAGAAPGLTVWYGSLPESNGKSNFTAMLLRKGASIMDGGEYTFAQSEYPDRVRYEADCMRHLIGELENEPDILAYDANKHSGYAAPSNPPAGATQEKE